MLELPPCSCGLPRPLADTSRVVMDFPANSGIRLAFDGHLYAVTEGLNTPGRGILRQVIKQDLNAAASADITPGVFFL